MPRDTEGRADIKGCTIQVVVKLANIVLTPENPMYPSGSVRHVEGLVNFDRVLATGLYCCACDFCTFGGSDETKFYKQIDCRGYGAAFKFGRDHRHWQRLGHGVAAEDTCVAFFNAFQRHADTFEFTDPSKPGCRKVVCFFLADLSVRIPSTTDVPPQQEDWSRIPW